MTWKFRFKLITGTCTIVLSALLLVAWFVPYSGTTEEVKQWYTHELEQFVKDTEALHDAARYSEGIVRKKQLKQSLSQCRARYKKVEFLLEHLFPDHAKMYFNGAPLPKAVPDSVRERRPEVVPPEGLQLLDELIFSEEIAQELAQIQALAALLVERSHDFLAFQEGNLNRLNDRRIFEACRFGILRIFTLGVTGFDTPSSGNAIPEALISLKSIGEVLEVYEDQLEQKAPKLAATLFEQLAKSESYLSQHQDFEAFNRMEWLRSHTQPLYAALLDAQLALNIPVMYDDNAKVDKWKYPVNYYSKEIFIEQFFSKEGFIGHYHANDNSQLIQLGRMLFFDPILSNNNKRSCASCHDPKKGFSDGLPKSLGQDAGVTAGRNSPGLINTVFATRFFHDLRVDNLEDQIDHVVFNPQEFSTDYEAITNKVFQSVEYQEMFRQSFLQMHDRQKQSGYILKMALAAYVASLQSFDSPVDRYIRGELDTISPNIIRGFNLFMGKAACGTCHFAPSFSGIVPPYFHETESEVLGVPIVPKQSQLDPDLGRHLSGRPIDKDEWYKFHFKTPGIRNVALTAPYMHNGAYATLQEVMTFYNNGGGAGIGINLENQTLSPDPLGLTSNEISDLISFMEGLTDTTGLTAIPDHLPAFPEEMGVNDRKIGGEY